MIFNKKGKIRWKIPLFFLFIFLVVPLVSSWNFDGYGVLNINVGGSINDTNASTACTGTQYLAGNGSCLEVGAIAGDTNETVRFDNLVGTNCSAGDFIIGHQQDGTIVCDTPSGSGDITSVNTTFDTYLYNGSDSGAVYLRFNDTLLNETIDARGAGSDNSSWNETYARTIFYLITNPYGFYNSTNFPYTHLTNFTNDLGYSNYTDVLNFTNGASYWNDTYATFNKTYADTLYASISVTGDNSSWNQSLADTLYAPIGVGGDNSSWNESYARGIFYLITNPFGFYNSTNFPYTHLSNFTDDLGHIEDNSSWNESYADTKYALIGAGADNSSWNESYANTLYYGIGNPYSYYNSTDFDISDYYLSSNPYGFWNDTYATFNKTYADTLYASISVTGDNSSWNESYANTLYSPIGSGNSSWNETYANTLYYAINNPYGYWNSTFALFNKTYADTLYAGIGVTGDNSSWNESYADTLYYGISNSYGYWNDTFATFNKTYADTLYASISVTGDNSSWNETYADTLYYGLGNPYSYYNSTNPQPDSNLTEDDVESYIFDSDNTANLGMNGYNVSNQSYATFCNGANCWKMYVNASDYFIIEEI